MNGCDKHMVEAFPGCRDCYNHLRGRYDFQKSETERLDKWADEQAKLLRDAISLREAATTCHDADMKHLVERTMERDAANLQLGEYRAIFGKVVEIIDQVDSEGDALLNIKSALTLKPKSDCRPDCRLCKDAEYGHGCSCHTEKRKCECACHPTNSQEQRCGVCNGNH